MNPNLRSHLTVTRFAQIAAAGIGIVALAACGPTPHEAPDASASPPSSPTGHASTQHPGKSDPDKANAGKPDPDKVNPGRTANDSGVTPDNPDTARNCTTEDLSVSTFRYDSGDDYVLARLNFKNTSGSLCKMNGYPGVSRMSAEDGHQVGPSAYRKSVGTFPSVALGAGEYAYSFVNIPDADKLSNAECQPATTTGLRVFPPNNTAATYLDGVGGLACTTDAGRMSVGPLTSDPDAIP